MKDSMCIFIEIFLRIALWILFRWLVKFPPFIRKIAPEETWLYKFPRQPSYVSDNWLWFMILGVPLLVFLMGHLRDPPTSNAMPGLYALTLAYCLNGVLTYIIKNAVGRPRPDFFMRCFPDGSGSNLNECVGRKRDIMEGLRSFPSGHSSFIFTSMVLVSLYIVRKLDLWNGQKQKHGWQLCLVLAPLLVATLVSISRTCDYHHHYTDIIGGGVLGIFVGFSCFFIYFTYRPPVRQLSRQIHFQNATCENY